MAVPAARGELWAAVVAAEERQRGPTEVPTAHSGRLEMEVEARVGEATLERQQGQGVAEEVAVAKVEMEEL